MKNGLYSLLITLGLCYGCSDFLEEKSQSEVRPSTVTDMEKILEGEAYPTEGYLFGDETFYFTDNIKCDNETNAIEERKKEKRRWYFTWDPEMFNEAGGGEDITFWSVPYDRIKGCNIVLDYIDGMEGNEIKREYLRGEAYALRGFYYMMLVNFFGMPYTVGNPEQEPGVPLKLVSGVSDELFSRNSVAEVYRRIESDLLEGSRLMRANDIGLASTYRLTGTAVHGLLSRMYLYMGDWDNVIRYADSVLAVSPELMNLAENTTMRVYDETSVELLWGISAVNQFSSYVYSSHVMAFTVSNDLVNVFGQDVDGGIVDVRGDYSSQRQCSYLVMGSSWMEPGVYWVSHVNKGNAKNTPGIRTAEVYLNRAEAYCRKYVETGEEDYGILALNDLNEVRRHRFETGYEDKTLESFTTADELLAFCLRERRRELCGECNHRWFDLRRTGMPAIEHEFFYKDQPGTLYRLEEGDSRYVLPIPEEVIRQNPNLSQNE